MRLVATLAAVVVCLVSAESAQALTCRQGPTTLERFRAADVVVVASRVSAQEVEPALPSPRPDGPPIAGWWGPRGPVVLFRYRILRVYKSDALGPRVGDVFTQSGRVPAQDWQPHLGWVGGFVLDRHDGSLDGTFRQGPCSPGQPPRTELRRAALLERYNTGRGAASSECSSSGESCWSVKRERGDAILRLATYAPDGDFTPLRLWDFERQYDLCVRAPTGRRHCKRFPYGLETSGLLSSRVSWSRHFPAAGRGTYTVEWLPPDFFKSGYKRHPHRRVLPMLSFRR